MKKLLKKLNPVRWFEFKREAIIVFANLKRNDKAYEHLDELIKVVWFLAYALGMIIFAILLKLVEWLL